MLAEIRHRLFVDFKCVFYLCKCLLIYLVFCLCVSVLKFDGLVKMENGTSFATPIMFSLAACL